VVFFTPAEDTHETIVCSVGSGYGLNRGWTGVGQGVGKEKKKRKNGVVG